MTSEHLSPHFNSEKDSNSTFIRDYIIPTNCTFSWLKVILKSFFSSLIVYCVFFYVYSKGQPVSSLTFLLLTLLIKWRVLSKIAL